MSSRAMPGARRAPPQSAAIIADEAYALVQDDPQRALEVARRASACAREEGDARAEAASLLALAWAQHVLGEPDSIRTARAGIRIAVRAGDRRGEALLRRRLALMLAFAGDARGSHQEIEAAVGMLTGLDRARSEVHRLGIHRDFQSADTDAYARLIADAADALRVLRRAGDEVWEARLLYNRGVLRLDRGELDLAEADLRRSHELCARLGMTSAVVDVGETLGHLALLRGDVVACLAALAEAESAGTAGSVQFGIAETKASALLQARLLPEARSAAHAYLKLCAGAARQGHVAGALLMLASVATLAGDPGEGRRLAEQAARSLAARGKPVNAALARVASIRARVREGTINRGTLRRGLAAAMVLEQAGWTLDAARARLVVVEAAAAVGARGTARRQLGLATTLRRGGTAADRVEYRYACALVAILEGDQRVAKRELARGLALLEAYRAALGALELRTSATGIGLDLAEMGVRLALESGRPTQLLSWSERQRANALRAPTVRPPADPAVGSLLERLRSVEAEIQRAESAARPARTLVSRQVAIEAAIRSRRRLVSGANGGSLGTPSVRKTAALLGNRVLIEYLATASSLHAITLADGRLAVYPLDFDAVAAELDWLGFHLSGLSRAGDAATRRRAERDAMRSAAILDSQLVAPLRLEPRDPVLLVPTGPLHALPWASLPSLRTRPLVVAPSLATWADIIGRPPVRRRKVAVVAGPRLRHARAEAQGIAGLLKNPTVLIGEQATSAATLSALEGAALAHIACHGRFRSDSPLFSSLELADGPLNAYELQGLRHAPEVIVLSACDLAVSGLRPGNELLGLAAALLEMGTRTIIASVVPVHDAATKRLMLGFHRCLAAGASPAVALARAQARARVAGFVCLGSG